MSKFLVEAGVLPGALVWTGYNDSHMMAPVEEITSRSPDGTMIRVPKDVTYRLVEYTDDNNNHVSFEWEVEA